jgi:hypothetical protein
MVLLSAMVVCKCNGIATMLLFLFTIISEFVAKIIDQRLFALAVAPDVIATEQPS